MVDQPLKFDVDPSGAIRDAVADALKKVDDLRPAWLAIIPSWFKGNRAIFKLGSAGKYADLSPGYKISKQRDVGFVYPILKREGAIERSITEAGDADSVVRMTPTDLELGTSNPIANYLHFGTKHMPARPVVMIGAEQTAPDEINMRKQRWIETIENFVLQASSGLGEVK